MGIAQVKRIIHRSCVLALLFVILLTGSVQAGFYLPRVQELVVPILGVSVDPTRRPVGVVSRVIIHFEKRTDRKGLRVQYGTTPGRFSLLARQSIYQAIVRASKRAQLSTDSWTVTVIFPYSGLTLYGKSLSAMVALSVVALAKGDSILQGRALTGTITEDGHIGKVGGVPLKVQAAYARHLRRVLIPQEYDVRDGDWRVPFLMQVSPVNTVDEAYFGLTGAHLHASIEAR
ncbi:MAG: hypothetical protein D6690_08835 [Nitrospirae bacterium]|nr:MAG: hypothetical protein D6690_08835 [Nitrospirota bacterium]